MWGARVSLTVGFAATFISIALGALIGILAGHFHGWLFGGAACASPTGSSSCRPCVLAIALATVLGRSLSTIIIAIGVTSWPTTARLVRAQTLAVEARPYIERARRSAAGTGTS